MNRQTLEAMRAEIIRTLTEHWELANGKSSNLPDPNFSLQKLNAWHELVCRELEHTREPHDVDECMRVIEEARLHLMDALNYHHVHHAGVQAAKDTLDAFVSKGGAS